MDTINETKITIDLKNLTDEERSQFAELILKGSQIKSFHMPKYGEKYFYISGDGDIMETSWFEYAIDIVRYEMNNCFKNREDARFAFKKLKVIAELQRFADKYNDEINWKDNKQDKFFIYHDSVNNDIDIYNTCSIHDSNIFFSSRKIAENAINTIGKERIQKYYLGIYK